MKILDFGSLNLDTVYRVDHIVQPGETLLPLFVRSYCGGKGLNQSIAIARAGCQVFHAGRVGPDGSRLLDQLKMQDAVYSQLKATTAFRDLNDEVERYEGLKATRRP